MRYLESSFSVPPADLSKGVNSHGQTWDDIFNAAKPVERRHESIPDATGDSLNNERQDEVSFWESENTDNFGHMCNGTYKTFSSEHCPYCWSEHAR